MALITFMSDFGTVDHYVAAVKAVILSEDNKQPLVDISHSIRPFDIAHAAHTIREVYRDFPEGTIHLLAVDSARGRSDLVALELHGHYFVGFDCGIFSLVSSELPTAVVSLEATASTFPVRDVLAQACLRLSAGEKLESLGAAKSELVTLYSRQLKVTKREIAGNVISVDHFGNLITNISQKEFETIVKLNGGGARYLIRFGREQFEQVHSYYTDVESGDCFVFFNSSGFLQIGINKGNASQLLGLSVDSPVLIEFGK